MTDFRATPRDRGSWKVESGGERYEYRYSTYEGAPGYRRTQARGGLVRNGIRVRIADVEGLIARLEIQD